MTPLALHPNFGDVTVGPELPTLGSARAETLSYSREITFEFSNLCEKNIPKRHRRTDRQTDKPVGDWFARC